MNVLSTEKRLRVLAALVDGSSERATERMTGVQQKTVGRFALRVGNAAQSLHNRIACDLSCSLIEVDEIWSFVGKKQARVTEAESAGGLGEAYTFVGLAMPSRFVVSWRVGKRDEATTNAFIADLRARLVVMPAMTSDGFAPYIQAIGKHLGPGVDYAQTIKNYRTGAARGPDHRYEPARDPFITKRTVFGAPDIKSATTAHIERQNGTMRHHIGRMRRLCYAFSKSPAHHQAAIALCYAHYNLCWVPASLRVTPAMAAGVTDHIWELPEFMDALLSTPECAAPNKKPLAPRVPVGTARELPNGRGFLRVVQGGNAPTAPPPEPIAPMPVVAAAHTPSPVSPPVDGRQLDLLSWREKPRTPRVSVQLSLFGLDMEPEPKK